MSEIKRKFFSVSDLEQLTTEQISEIYKNISEESRLEFENKFQELKQEILLTDPIFLLSHLSFYDLIYSLSHEKDNYINEEKFHVLQSHVELLQGLILQYKTSEFSSKSFSPETTFTIRKLVYDVAFSFSARNFPNFDKETPLDELTRISILEQVKNSTQTMRNWGYPHQMIKIISGLFAPLEDEIEEKLGVRINYLLQMIYNLTLLVEEKAKKHSNFLRDIFNSPNVPALVNTFFEKCPYPFLKSSPEEMLKILLEKNLELQNAKILLASYSDVLLPEIYTFDLKIFQEAYPQCVNPERLNKVLNSWALSFGELTDRNSEYLFMDNPIWYQPLIYLNENQYFCPLIAVFQSFFLEIAENLLRNEIPETYEKYEKYRGKYLEKILEETFNLAFPDEKIYPSVKWYDPTTNQIFENDLLVFIDSYLLIIEAKSGKLTPPAKRGAESHLKRTLDDLITKSSLQSERLIKYLKESPGIRKLITKEGNEIEIDTSKIKEIISLSITLEELSVLSSRLPDLQKSGLISKKGNLNLTMSFCELEIVFDLLEKKCEKIHYLIRRAQFGINAHYLGDELDLLVFYLETGFNIGESEFNNTGLFLWGMSEDLNPYFMKQWYGEELIKPKLKQTLRWNNLLNKIEKRKRSQWLEICLILLNVSYENQIDFEINLEEVIKIVTKDWNKPGHINVFHLINGPKQRRNSILALAYKTKNIEERNNMMTNAGNQALENSGSNDVLIIGIDIEENDGSYGVLAYMKKAKDCSY